MPHRLMNTEEKPYNQCLDCIYIGKKCDGPNFLAMDIKRLSEWARLRKNFLHSKDPKWTNEYIAKLSGLSLTTVSRFLSGDLEDIKLSTAAAIIRVLVDGTWGQYPCAMAAGEGDFDQERLMEQITSEKAKTEYLKKQIDIKDNQMAEKDKVIKANYHIIKQRMRTTAVLASLLGICIFIIIAALVFDIVSPNIGFFWR